MALFGILTPFPSSRGQLSFNCVTNYYKQKSQHTLAIINHKERLALSPSFPPSEERSSVPLLASHHSASHFNDGGGCYKRTNITRERVVNEALFHPKTQLNDALIESHIGCNS